MRTMGLLVRLVAAVVAAGGAVVAVPSPAGAVVLDAQCAGTETATYDPGVTLSEQHVVSEVEAHYLTCLSSDPAITSGVVEIHAEGMLSCLSGTVSGTQTITWNTGEVSSVAFTLAVSVRPLGQVVVIANGTVTSGKFAGDDVLQTAAVPAPTVAQCLTTGITEASGATTATITAP